MPFLAVLPKVPCWPLLFFSQKEKEVLGGVSAFLFATISLMFLRIEVIANKLMCYLIYFISRTLCQKSGRRKNHIFLSLFWWASVWSHPSFNLKVDVILKHYHLFPRPYSYTHFLYDMMVVPFSAWNWIWNLRSFFSVVNLCFG